LATQQAELQAAQLDLSAQLATAEDERANLVAQKEAAEQAAAEAAGNILQPADHQRADCRSDIAGSVDYRDTDSSGAQADRLIRSGPKNGHCAKRSGRSHHDPQQLDQVVIGGRS